MRGTPRIWAHRGASAHAPENTLDAFELTRSAGADGIELDVRLDRDGNVVVFHDRDLQRLCGRPGRIEDLYASECQQLRVAGARVPLLADVFHNDRWDYYFDNSKRGRLVDHKKFVVVFKDDKLVSWEGESNPPPPPPTNPNPMTPGAQ